MKETRDPAIKLFGKEIVLPEKAWIPMVSEVEESGRYDHNRSSRVSTNFEGKKLRRTEETEQKQDQKDEEEPEALKDSLADEDPTNQETQPDSGNNPETPPINEEEKGTSKPPECENDPNNSSEQKTLKKPDKILPCPRCNSMDTKFCYYNNYNVNQPRHFCKSCQRYWTAGGSMRNVPVGAGRRKNKSGSSHCRPITISEALQGVPDGIHHPGLKVNGTVLSFGPEAPLCESMASVLKLAEKAAPNGLCNGFYRGEQGEVKDDCSSGGSSVTSSNSVRARNGVPEPIMTNLNGFTSQIPCPPGVPGVPWPYPWSSVVPVPAYPPSGYPMPFYPVPYWNCSVPGGWNVPWVSPSSPSTNLNSPNSPTLGKHSRDGELLKPIDPERKALVEQMNSENSIVIPKTLRIDDPDEAARSSIWSTLGIKNESIGRKSLFKGFQPKSHEKNHISETQSALCANPAAMSRSFNFQETA